MGFYSLFFFSSPVSLRVIISEQFWSSTLLHGFEWLPQLWMHYVSVCSSHSDDASPGSKAHSASCLPTRSTIALLLSVHILFIVRMEGASGTAYYGNVKLLTIEHPCFFRCTYLLPLPVWAVPACILIVARMVFFFFYCFLFVWAVERTAFQPPTSVVPAECHLIYRLSVRKQVRIRPHSTEAWSRARNKW